MIPRRLIGEYSWCLIEVLPNLEQISVNRG